MRPSVRRSSRCRRGFAVTAALAAAAPLAAHDTGNAAGPPDLAAAWTLDPWLLAGFALAVALYAAGVRRLWSRAGIGHGIERWRVAAFAAGIVACGLALVWPLDALGEWSLAAHMAQHMLLMAVAAPLLALGRPQSALLHALPERVVAASFAGPLRGLSRRIGPDRPIGLGAATALQAAAMVFWHLPAPLAAALENEAVHVLMHLSFLAAGLLFWAGVLGSVRSPRTGFGGGALALLATMALMGLLGALLTFAARPLYSYYLDRAPALGLDPLADQQLAGLLMWVPSALPYLLGAALLARAWLARVRRREAAMDARLGRGGDRLP